MNFDAQISLQVERTQLRVDRVDTGDHQRDLVGTGVQEPVGNDVENIAKPRNHRDELPTLPGYENRPVLGWRRTNGLDCLRARAVLALNQR